MARRPELRATFGKAQVAPSDAEGRSERLAKDGEPARNRTENQQIKSLLLYQLSYGPTKGGVVTAWQLTC